MIGTPLIMSTIVIIKIILMEYGFDDETLRDGLQSPSARNPTIEQKLELLDYMEKLGIQKVVGLAWCRTFPSGAHRCNAQTYYRE